MNKINIQEEIDSLLDREFYWVQWRKNDDWEIARFKVKNNNGFISGVDSPRFKFTDGSQTTPAEVYAFDPKPIKKETE